MTGFTAYKNGFSLGTFYTVGAALNAIIKVSRGIKLGADGFIWNLKTDLIMSYITDGQLAHPFRHGQNLYDIVKGVRLDTFYTVHKGDKSLGGFNTPNEVMEAIVKASRGLITRYNDPLNGDVLVDYNTNDYHLFIGDLGNHEIDFHTFTQGKNHYRVFPHHVN